MKRQQFIYYMISLIIMDLTALLVCAIMQSGIGVCTTLIIFISLAIGLYGYIVNSTPQETGRKSGSMSGLEYEHWCAVKITKSGKFTNVTVTPPTGDFGADIVAIDKARRKWVFQCKHYKSSLGNKPIQEVVGAKAHYHADCAAVVTNSTFTANARQLAKENKVKLFEGISETGSSKKHGHPWRNYSVEEMAFYDDIFDD